MPNRTQVTAVDFAVPTDYTIGPRFPTWREAVEDARSKIHRLEYRDQTIKPDAPEFHPRRYFQEGNTLVVYTRSFVQMRVTEPIQDRPDGGEPHGLDDVRMSWEVFHDGTVEAMEDSGAAAAEAEMALAAQNDKGDDEPFKALIISTYKDGTKFWTEVPDTYGYVRSTGSPMLDHIRATLNTMGVATVEILVDTSWQSDEDDDDLPPEND